MRRLIRSYVEASDIEVVEAEDGVDALEKLQQNAGIDFALVDWDMPRMNGLEFVKAVRAKPEYKELTIMMVTSHNSSNDIAEAIAAGSNDFLMKPFNEDMILDKLRMLGVVN